MISTALTSLLPKIREYFAEFLQHGCFFALVLYQSTCVGLGTALYSISFYEECSLTLFRLFYYTLLSSYSSLSVTLESYSPLLSFGVMCPLLLTTYLPTLFSLLTLFFSPFRLLLSFFLFFFVGKARIELASEG